MNKIQIPFNHLLWRPAGKQSGPILKGKDKRKVNKKVKYKQQKKKASLKKKKEASDKINKHTNNVYI